MPRKKKTKPEAGADPASQKTGGVKPDPKPKTVRPAGADPDADPDLMAAIGPVAPGVPDGNNPDPGLVDASLEMVSGNDSAAAVAARSKKPAEKKSKPAPDPDPKKAAAGGPPDLPPDIKAMMAPGVLADLVVNINAGLAAGKSPWATNATEARNIGQALEAVVDKYLPLDRAWSAEMVLAVLLAVYLIPRGGLIKEAIQRRRAKSPRADSGPDPDPSADERLTSQVVAVDPHAKKAQ